MFSASVSQRQYLSRRVRLQVSLPCVAGKAEVCVCSDLTFYVRDGQTKYSNRMLLSDLLGEGCWRGKAGNSVVRFLYPVA